MDLVKIAHLLAAVASDEIDLLVYLLDQPNKPPGSMWNRRPDPARPPN
jgi:hypothetical protein